MSRDISTAGAYIHTATAPSPDVMVQAEILIDMQATAPKMRIEFTGRVVRVERESADPGFALASDSAAVFEITSQTPRVVHEDARKSGSRTPTALESQAEVSYQPGS